MSRKEVSNKMKAALQRARVEAHERVVKRGLVQFRADRELMEQLLAVADHKRMAVGPLVRSWIAPIVKQEYEVMPLERVLHPSGKVLTPGSDVSELQQAISDHESGRLTLSLKQFTTIQDWLWAGRGGSEPLDEIRLSDVRVLTARSPYVELTAVYNAYKRGAVKLKVREYNAIVDWMIQQGERGAEAG